MPVTIQSTERRETAAEKREREEEERAAKRKSAREIRRVSGQLRDLKNGFRKPWRSRVGEGEIGVSVTAPCADAEQRAGAAKRGPQDPARACGRVNSETFTLFLHCTCISRTETGAPRCEPTAHVTYVRLDIFVPITSANLESDPVKLNKRPGGAHNAEDLDAEESRLQRDRESARRFMSAGTGGSVSSVACL